MYRKSRMVKRGTTYLFELLNVDVELASQFCFCVGKGGDLVCQSTTTRRLCVGSSTFNLILCLEVAYLGVFMAKYSFEMCLTNIGLIG